MPINIMTLLKEKTAGQHKKAEENDFAHALMDNSMTLSKYTMYLQKWYGFYQPLESHIVDRQEWTQYQFDFRARIKLPLIEQDLTSLGLTKAEIKGLPMCTNLPQVSKFSQILGCLYVLEGSTLGGQFIMNKLKQSMPIDPETNGRFMSSYGTDVRQKWSEYGQLVEAYTETDEMAEEIVQFAQDTFLLFNEWLKK